MGAVIGVNAIWTNTYVRSDVGKIGFPRTKFLLWKGAHAERPFKAYVRKSQAETLVWYSAYHTLNVVNIINNNALRKAVFKPLDTAALDALATRL